MRESYVANCRDRDPIANLTEGGAKEEVEYSNHSWPFTLLLNVKGEHLCEMHSTVDATKFGQYP